MEVGLLVENWERMLRCIGRTLWRAVILKELNRDAMAETDK